MPTIYNKDGVRIWFFSADCSEPAHVHVAIGDGVGKYWLDPVKRAKSYGLKGPEKKKIRKLLKERKDEFIAAWEIYCSNYTP